MTAPIEGVVNSPLGPFPKDPVARLKKAAAGVEALCVKQVLSEARPKSVMMHSFATDTFNDMFNDVLAQSMAQKGVFGLADSLTRQLLPRVSPSPQATERIGKAGA